MTSLQGREGEVPMDWLVLEGLFYGGLKVVAEKRESKHVDEPLRKTGT